ncbi:Deoxyadenosine/deoxycytidine kinase [Mesotoga infera]|uniref:Deoxyadenosine/deoxycytidine kinase n=1 Tax=Mesotoga infera TaxID=1236046 RepID=A0A7Z7LCR9_9BACT|nr:deoxynucleoside kinase [Mesotoga infera]SSC11647.1 Deoxyadenosine/deoxycytidine kinase [Mesotoga infera]
MGRIIVFAGNVGAGKSTIAGAVAERLRYGVHFESVSDNPFLEDFYYDQKRWSYHLQTYFLYHRYCSLKHAEANENMVFDRSIYEDAEIFARNLFETGKMSRREYDAYTTMFYAMINYLKNPDLLVYIDADIDTILTRIRRRGREMELAVPIAYWEQLDRLYSDWISSYNRSPVYRIDARIVDIVTNPGQLDTVMRDIEAIING